MTGIEESLIDFELFGDLEPEHLALLAGGAETVTFLADEHLLVADQPADTIYAIRSGRVAIEIDGGNRGPVIIETIGGGDVVGISWLLPPYRWTFGARAVDDVEAVRLDAISLRHLCDEHPVFGYAIFKRFTRLIHRRLVATRVRATDLYGLGGRNDMTPIGVEVGRETDPLGPMTPVMYRVVSVVDENAETVTLELEPTDGTIERPRPGQFNMLWAFGVGEVPISLARLEGDRLLHTIRRVGAVTTALCAVAVGDLVGVRGPFGNGWPIDRAEGRDALVVAGGLGLAPVRPLIEELVAQNDHHRRVVVLVGARSPEGVLYNDLLGEWQSTAGTDVEITVDTAPASWRGHVGLVTQLMEGAAVNHPETILYTCGPEIMMRFAATTFKELGGSFDRSFISLERNMHCGIGHCGHCQLGPALLCLDGPVLDWTTAAPLLAVRER